MRKVLALALCAVLLTACRIASPDTAGQGGSVSLALTDAIAALDVAKENRDGYERDKFKLWTDEDGDGCDTRKEVLIAEATKPPKVGSSCKLTGGSWLSYYDNETWTAPGDVDIDHLVPLAEAWDSGASEWTAKQREEYANDLGDDRDLVAVTDNLNQQKSDQDPAEWMPPLEDATCRYVGEWVAVKLRWRLAVDAEEKAALEKYAEDCSNDKISVDRAI